jgi:preprotein translocase subunit SecG
MYFLLIGLIVVAALLLCFVVMIQNSKGGGLASSFASSNQIMGVRKTTDFLEKATWTLAVVIAVFCIVSAYLLPTRAELGHDSVLLENAMEDNAVNPETLPDFDMPAQEGSAE